MTPPATQVTHVGSHDTASAVASVPAEGDRFAYISCGTWGLVGVEQMAIERAEDAVQVSFNLTNVAEGGEPVSGYVHILASGKENGSPWWDVYPRGEVGEDGTPESYRLGLPFIIQRFKPIQGRFSPGPGRGLPEAVRVVVYDDTGRLIYNEAFEVANAS